MTIERMLRGMAGFIILLSLILSYYVNRHWLWLTAFVGLNLFQSAFTNWCLAMTILRKYGIRAPSLLEKNTQE